MTLCEILEIPPSKLQDFDPDEKRLRDERLLGLVTRTESSVETTTRLFRVRFVETVAQRNDLNPFKLPMLNALMCPSLIPKSVHPNGDDFHPLVGLAVVGTMAKYNTPAWTLPTGVPFESRVGRMIHKLKVHLLVESPQVSMVTPTLLKDGLMVLAKRYLEEESPLYDVVFGDTKREELVALVVDQLLNLHLSTMSEDEDESPASPLRTRSRIAAYYVAFKAVGWAEAHDVNLATFRGAVEDALKVIGHQQTPPDVMRDLEMRMSKLLSPAPYESSQFASGMQTSLFRAVGPLYDPVAFAVTGNVLDYIPLAQTFIDNTRYDAAETLVKKMWDLYRRNGVNDPLAVGNILFIQGETYRMMRYLDIVNHADARNPKTDPDVICKEYYRKGIAACLSIPYTPATEKTRASLLLGLARTLMEEVRSPSDANLHLALGHRREAFELRERYLGEADPLTVQAEYAEAEMLRKIASFHRSADAHMVPVHLLGALEILSRVQTRWERANKWAYVATLREKRAEVLHEFSLVSYIDLNPEKRQTQLLFLGRAVGEIHQCRLRRGELFGKAHLRYMRAAKYEDELTALYNEKRPGG